MKEHYGCPVKATSNILAGKWKVLIVWHLGSGSHRFAELRDLLPGVSEKVLTTQLRDLERDGILTRVSDGQAPARVDYMLSDAGKDLLPVMQAMCSWATRHLGLQPTLPPLTIA